MNLLRGNETMEEKRLPSFFLDDSTSDKYEGVADFFLAWTVRCAQKKYEAMDTMVHSYAKRLLSTLIKGDADYLDTKDVLSVKTWKQRKSVDIWVEAKIREGRENKLYAVIIEDKYCSKLTGAQLEKYKHIPMYGSGGVDVKYAVIRLEQDDAYDKTDEAVCADWGYTLLRWSDLKKAMGLTKHTGNALFDEFWFYWEEDVLSGTEDGDT
jgi:hypothetical protein